MAEINKKNICLVGRSLYQRGLVCALEGNLSVRTDDQTIWCTPAGQCKGRLKPGDLALVDLDGRPLNGKRPSSELKMHLKVYQRRPDAKAVVHAHPPWASALAVSGRALDKCFLTENVHTLGPVPLAPYAAPSTDEVPESIEPYLAGHRAVLLAHHGALTWAEDLWTAYYLMESLESAARISILAELMGGAREIPPEQLLRLKGLAGR